MWTRLSAEILFEASMEFVVPAGEEDEDDDDDDDSSSYAAALPPTFSPVATETLPLRFDYSHREEQAAAMAMGGGASAESFGSAPKDYYTVRLRGTDPQRDAGADRTGPVLTVSGSPSSSVRRPDDRRRLPASPVFLLVSPRQHLDLHPVPGSLLLTHTAAVSR